MRILVIGDTHGDKDNISNLMDVAISNECDKIFQVGDFGYFPHIEKHNSFLDFCSAEIHRSGIPIHFIRGNHDDVVSLKKFGFGIHSIRENLFYHSDGFVWEWCGKRMVGIGGAYSIDRKFRTEGIDWFKDEQIPLYLTEKEIGKVDIVFSHDAPMSSSIDSLLDFGMDIGTIGNRNKLQLICENVRCGRLFHGHYHKRYDCRGRFVDGERFDIVSLGANCNMLSEQWEILEI